MKWTHKPAKTLENARWFAQNMAAEAQLKVLKLLWKLKPPTTKMTEAEIEAARRKMI